MVGALLFAGRLADADAFRSLGLDPLRRVPTRSSPLLTDEVVYDRVALVPGRRLREELNQDAVGAGILLGLRGLAFVTHGNATPVGVATAVRLAHRAVEEGVVERTEAALRESGSLAAAPSATAVSVGSGS